MAENFSVEPSYDGFKEPFSLGDVADSVGDAWQSSTPAGQIYSTWTDGRGSQPQDGRALAESVTEHINKSLLEIISRDVQQCATLTNVSQSIDLKSKGDVILGDIGQKQRIMINVDCYKDTSRMNDLQDKIVADLTKFVDMENKTLGDVLGRTEQNIHSTIDNEVKRIINYTTMNNMISEINANENIQIESDKDIVIGNISQEQVLDNYIKGMSKSLEQTQIFTDLVSRSEEEQEFKMTVGEGSKFLLYIILIILCVITASLGYFIYTQQATSYSYPRI